MWSAVISSPLSSTSAVALPSLEIIFRTPHFIRRSPPAARYLSSFRALKVWLSFKAFGIAAFRAAVERGLALAEYAETVLRESAEWEIVSPAQMGIVAFRYLHTGMSEEALNALTHKMVEAMTTGEFAFASSTTIRGQAVLRLCTINPRTTEEDIRNSLNWMADLGRTLSRQ